MSSWNDFSWDKVKEYRTNPATAVVLLIIGLILLLFPKATLAFLCAVIGWGLVIAGAGAIISSLLGRNDGMVTAASVVMIVIGALFITHPGILLSIVPFLIGIGIVIDGIYNVIQVWPYITAGGKATVDGIMDIAMIVIGVLVVINPFGTVAVIVRLIGVVLIYLAIRNLINYKKA